MRGRATALALALAATSLAASSRAALDDEAVRARSREVLANPEYQTGRPDGSADKPPDLPPPRRTERSRDFSDNAPVSAPSEISAAIIWIVLGGILLFVVVLVAGQTSRHLRKRKLGAPKGKTSDVDLDAVSALDAERLDETLRAAMELARQGRFEEAVHLLLAGAIADLQRGAGLATEVALTSRELLEQASLRPEPKAAFRELVFAVEVSLFGGLAVGPDDFARCADSFRTLRQAVAA